MVQRGKTVTEDVRKAYARKGVVLVLGAGVSVQSGIPSWDELLLRLANHRGLSSLYRSMREQGFSLAAIAGAIESRYGSRDEFVRVLRSILYSRAPARNLDRPTVIDVAAQNPTLRAIAAMCVVHDSEGFRPNALVRCVVTFNLDTLLERFANERYKSDLLRSIGHPAMSSTPKFVSVYHMHGVVDVDLPVDERIVLTEHDYFDFFSEPFGAFSYTFLYLLRE